MYKKKEKKEIHLKNPIGGFRDIKDSLLSSLLIKSGRLNAIVAFKLKEREKKRKEIK